jgi:hypothetical protein
MPAAAPAQIPGNIDYAAFGDAPAVMGEYARGLNDDAGKTNYAGARFVIPLSRVTVFAGAGFSEWGDPMRLGVGGGVAVPLVGVADASFSLSAQAGFGFTKVFGDAVWAAPVGLAIRANPSGNVQPWVMPMLSIVHAGDTEVGFAASGGADIALGPAFGLHLAAQFEAIAGATPIGIGAGVHYRLR